MKEIDVFGVMEAFVDNASNANNASNAGTACTADIFAAGGTVDATSVDIDRFNSIASGAAGTIGVVGTIQAGKTTFDFHHEGVHSRMVAEDFLARLQAHTDRRVINYDNIQTESGILFHGSKHLLESLKPGFDLYNDGNAVNCHNVGGWCRGISLTDDIDTAATFAGCCGYIYVVKLDDVNVLAIDVNDAAWLFDIVDNLRSNGVDLVVINNDRESEAVLINPAKAVIEMYLTYGKVDALRSSDKLWKMLDAMDENVICLDIYREEAFGE